MDVLSAFVKQQEDLLSSDNEHEAGSSMMHRGVKFGDCFEVEQRGMPSMVKSYSKNTFVITAITKKNSTMRSSPGVRIPPPGTRVALKILLMPRRISSSKLRDLLDGVGSEARAMHLLKYSSVHCGHHPNIQKYFGWFVCEQQTDLLAAFIAATDPSFSPEATAAVERQYLPQSVIIVQEFYSMLLRVDNDDDCVRSADDGRPFTSRSFLHCVPNAVAHLPSLIRDMKDALSFLCEKKVSHLAIKPSNIAVIEDNSAVLLDPQVAAAEIRSPTTAKASSPVQYCAVLLNFRYCHIFSNDEMVWDRGLTNGPNSLPPALSEGDATSRLLGSRTAGDMRILPFRDADFYSLLRLEYSIMNRELNSKSEDLKVTQHQLSRTKQQLQQCYSQCQSTQAALSQRELEVEQLQEALRQCMSERDMYMQPWKPPEVTHVLSSHTVLSNLLDSLSNLKHPVVLHLIVDRSSTQNNSVSTAIVDDEWLSTLALLNNVFIATLDLEMCSKISDESIRTVARRSSQLEYVNLYGCQITDAAVKLLAASCPRLKFVSLHGFLVTDVSLLALGGGPCASSIEHLRLHGCSVTDASMIVVAERCTNLESLHLHFCSLITDEVILELVNNSSKMTSLVLAGSKKLTDESLKAIALGLPLLVHLDMSMCPLVTDFAVMLFGGRPKTSPASAGRRGSALSSGSPCLLERADFAGCHKLTDRSLFHMLAMCELLTHLSFSSCKHITGAVEVLRRDGTPVSSDSMSDAEALASVLLGDEVNVSWGKKFPPRLVSFDISFCPKVSPRALRALVDEVRFSIEELNIAGCAGITDETVEDIILRCSSIRTVNVADCDAIFDYSVNELRCRFPKVTFVSVCSH